MTTYLYALDGEAVAVYTAYEQHTAHANDTTTQSSQPTQPEKVPEHTVKNALDNTLSNHNNHLINNPINKQVNSYQPLKLQDIPVELQSLIQEDAIEFDGVDKYAKLDALQNNQNDANQTSLTNTKTQPNTDSTTNSIDELDKHLVLNLKNLSDKTLQQLQQTLPLQIIPIRNLLTCWQQTQIYHVFKAMQVLRWREEHTFCSRCGGRTSQHRRELAMVCNTCNYRQYPRLQPCVIVAVTRKVNHAGKTKSQILLAKDRRFKRDMYSVLAGFVEVGETLEQAVEREIFEETAIRVGNIRYLASQPWAFPSNIMIAFQAEYVSGEINIDTDELLHAEFYDYDALPNVPPQGSISYAMIRHICDNQPFQL